MTMQHFLCGCDSQDPYVRNYHPKLVWQNGQQVLSFKHYDKRGQEICPIHGKPLKGSAYPTKRGPQGNEIHDDHAAFLRKYGGKLPPWEHNSTVQDRRDNRDPEEVGKEFLAGRPIREITTVNTAGNGIPPSGPARWGSD